MVNDKSFFAWVLQNVVVVITCWQQRPFSVTFVKFVIVSDCIYTIDLSEGCILMNAANVLVVNISLNILLIHASACLLFFDYSVKFDYMILKMELSFSVLF